MIIPILSSADVQMSISKHIIPVSFKDDPVISDLQFTYPLSRSQIGPYFRNAAVDVAGSWHILRKHPKTGDLPGRNQPANQ